MPKWTCKVTIVNALDRPLKLISSQVPWGKIDGNFPQTITAHGRETYTVFSPSGKAYGPEFFLSFSDEPADPATQNPYGTLDFYFDIPFGKHENTSYCKTTGILKANGFIPVPDGAHDHSTTVTISSPFAHLLEAFLMDSTNDYGNWEKIKDLMVLDTFNLSEAIPKENIYKAKAMLGRFAEEPVSKELWTLINDAKFKDDYSKYNFVKSYFTVCVFELRRNKQSISISANMSYTKTLEITHTSTTRNSQSKTYRLENVMEAGYTGENLSLRDTVTSSYELADITEFCDENQSRVTEEFNYGAVDYDRDIVIWDFAKMIALYREDIKGNIELIGLDDYFIDSKQKTYADEMEEVLLSATYRGGVIDRVNNRRTKYYADKVEYSAANLGQVAPGTKAVLYLRVPVPQSDPPIVRNNDLFLSCSNHHDDHAFRVDSVQGPTKYKVTVTA